MIHAAIIIALLQPSEACEGARPLEIWRPAPCSGLLISTSQAREALKCKVELLPKCEADRKRDVAILQAQVDELLTKNAANEALIKASKPDGFWLPVVLTAGSFAAGLVIGFAAGL